MKDTMKDKENTDFAIKYFEHQYDRMGKLEQSGLTITNFVISLSILGFIFGFNNSENSNVISGIILPVAIVVANLFAILYISRSANWLRSHRNRAKAVLNKYASELYEIDKNILDQGDKKFLGRRDIQQLIHILLLLCALVPIFFYFLQ